jgi:hypothetical protein
MYERRAASIACKNEAAATVERVSRFVRYFSFTPIPTLLSRSYYLLYKLFI